MGVGDRTGLADAARRAIEAQAGRMPDLQLRTMVVPESGGAGTRLFAAVERALADIPRARFAGTVAITDGQVHDIPAGTPGGEPLNVLLPAKGEQTDRTLRVLEAPGYGIVGKPVTLRVEVDDLGVAHPAATARLTVRRDNEPAETEIGACRSAEHHYGPGAAGRPDHRAALGQ